MAGKTTTTKITFPSANSGGAEAGKAIATVLLSEESRSACKEASPITYIPASSLVPSEDENDIYNIDKLDALAYDISRRGIQEPLRVVPMGMGMYKISGGHRRHAANALAVERYGYKDGNVLPCIIMDAPDVSRQFENTENLILDNLQRDKTDYERMMEIVKMEECIDCRKAAGEDIPSVREELKLRLGVSDTEITRFKKIYTSMDSVLMPDFRNDRIASTVAYEVARCEPDCQAYIAANWDRSLHENLSSDLVTTLSRKFISYRSCTEDVPVEKAPSSKKSVVTPKTIHEGVEMLDRSFGVVRTALSAPIRMDKRTEDRVLKKIAKHMQALTALQDELISLGLCEPPVPGEDD